ncbi:hypothetical protein ACFO25_06770 [Paenactinomyces guangxiensis]|uniref:F5/8 type C domain-containing protein n=1 Tax=Paenactinomyces guangxiensis TaxID=1490290 RepID=A0A7W2A7L3_9BACL|nr:hypothetical protein [Paenactinomyces guangxiensis]MBA4493247.1 hypothetical protein [Paenactinomyces guangxiensis]MBH8589902.1 hypothetical protein [Paenactinomyces guangxiensis]
MPKSGDGKNWRPIADQSKEQKTEGIGPHVDTISLDNLESARYIRISMTACPGKSGAKAGSSQRTPDAFSLWEVEVYLR